MNPTAIISWIRDHQLFLIAILPLCQGGFALLLTIVFQIINSIVSHRNRQYCEERFDILETKIDNLSGNLNEYLDGLPDTHQKTMKGLFEKGYQAKKENDWDKAIKFFHQALECATGMEFVTLQTLIGNCQFSQGKINSALKLYNSTLTTAQQIDDTRNMAVLHGNIGLIYIMKGKLEKAKDSFFTSLRLAEGQNMQKCAINQYGNLGIVYQMKGNNNEALKKHEKALKAAKKINYQDAVVRRLCSIALTYQVLGKLDKAVEYVNRGLTMALELNDEQTKLQAYNAAGIINSYIGNLDTALKYHEEALVIAKDTSDKLSEANQIGNIGAIYRMRQQFNKALEKEKETLAIFEEIGYDYGIVSAMNGIGMILMERGIRAWEKRIGDKGEKDTKESAAQLEKAFFLAERMNLISTKINILNNIGILYWFINKLDKAMECHTEVLRIARITGNRNAEGSALVGIGSVYEKMGDFEKALDSHKQASDVFSQIGAKRKNANIKQVIKDLKKKINKSTDQ